MEEKKAIRKQIFAKRKEHTDQQIEKLSRQVSEQVQSLAVFQEADKIYAYVDYNHEVMTGFLIEEAWKRGKKVAVPKVVGKDLVFYELKSFDQLEEGYFHIPEPARGEIVDWTDPLIIIPGEAYH